MDQMITVIIPTYRRPLLLKRAIESVLRQTYGNFKLIICDNHSEDATQEIITPFLWDSRVQFFSHEKNIGMGANYAFGFSKVTTPYFCFLSDDDYYEPWFLQNAIEDLRRYPRAAFSAWGVQVVEGDGTPTIRTLEHWSFGYFEEEKGFLAFFSPLYKVFVPTCTLFNRQILQDLQPKWDEEVLPLWDHVYFIRIASQFPYSINQKVCGFFLDHQEGFSTALQRGLSCSSESIKCYCKAAAAVLVATRSCPFSQITQSRARKSLMTHFLVNLLDLLKKNLKEKRLLSALRLTRETFKSFWFETHFWSFLLLRGVGKIKLQSKLVAKEEN
jgi:glycosyltransferase involved in cell wall biosynthesis